MNEKYLKKFVVYQNHMIDKQIKTMETISNKIDSEERCGDIHLFRMGLEMGLEEHNNILKSVLKKLEDKVMGEKTSALLEDKIKNIETRIRQYDEFISNVYKLFLIFVPVVIFVLIGAVALGIFL